MRLCVEDDGVGLPAERQEGSLGLPLIEMFARQIKGRAAMENRTDGGGRWWRSPSPTPTPRRADRAPPVAA